MIHNSDKMMKIYNELEYVYIFIIIKLVKKWRNILIPDIRIKNYRIFQNSKYQLLKQLKASWLSKQYSICAWTNTVVYIAVLTLVRYSVDTIHSVSVNMKKVKKTKKFVSDTWNYLIENVEASPISLLAWNSGERG